MRYVPKICLNSCSSSHCFHKNGFEAELGQGISTVFEYDFGIARIYPDVIIIYDIMQLELTEHITHTLMVNLSSSRASYIHILPELCNDSACRLVCQW